MNKAFSNFDLDKYIKEVNKNGLNMFLTKNIDPNRTTMENQFGDSGHCILFHDYNDGSGIGHWITTLRDREGNYYFVDSMGEHPDHYDPDIMKCYENNKSVIKTLSINKKKVQNNNSMTCGRYSIILTSLNKKGMHPSDMIDFLIDGGKEEGSVDKFIVKLFGDN